MSEEQLKAFLEAVKNDAGIQEKLNAAANADAVVAIAKEAGFVISADSLMHAPSEVSDEELESAAGGMAKLGNNKGGGGGGGGGLWNSFKGDFMSRGAIVQLLGKAWC